jgi:hypothetical protein
MMVLGCNRLDETWSRLSIHRTVHMTIHIHVPKEKRTKSKPSRNKGRFVGYKISHMEIYCKENKAPNMTLHIPLIHLITLHIIMKSQ